MWSLSLDLPSALGASKSCPRNLWIDAKADAQGALVSCLWPRGSQMVKLGLFIRTECLLPQLNSKTQILLTGLHSLVEQSHSFSFTICIVRTYKFSEKLKEQYSEHPYILPLDLTFVHVFLLSLCVCVYVCDLFCWTI